MARDLRSTLKLCICVLVCCLFDGFVWATDSDTLRSHPIGKAPV